MLQAAPATRDGSATLTVEGGESPKAVDDTKASRIVKTRQSANPFDAAVVVDGDPVTAWSATPGATPHEAYVVLDLGKPRAIRSARWLEAPDELSGTLRVEVSTNGKRWQKAAGREQAATDPWQDLRLKHPVETRYVRMLFTNPTGAPLLGGPAEVEIRLAAHAEAQRHGPKAERHRGKAGHGKVKAGKQHTGSKDQKVKKDQHQGHNDRNGRKNHKTGKSRHHRGQQGRGA